MHLRSRSVSAAPAAVTGWAALRWLGAAYFDGLARDGRGRYDVQLAVGDRVGGRRRHPGVRFSYERLEEGEVREVRGLAVTDARRALFDELRRRGRCPPEEPTNRTGAASDLRAAVVAMDMAAAAGLVSIDQLRCYLAGRAGWRRAGQAAAALELASEHSRSPAETRLRLTWVLDAGLPAPLVNRELFDLGGRLVCIPDLFDPVAGLVVEYDGAEHRRLSRHRRDVEREEACRRLGLEYCKVTALDRTAEVVARLTSTRSRALFLPPRSRRWTLTPPTSWRPSGSLDDRLEERAWLAEQVAREREHGVVS